MRTEHPDFDPYPPEAAQETVHLARIVRVLKRARFTIGFSILGVALLIAMLAAATMLFAPAQRIVTLPFRLEFRGAELGLYPNGTKFSSPEIVATPILNRVYSANGLQRFISFEEFNQSIFIVESNPALEELNREYQAKLTDARLTSVDRERLETEFRQKRESLARNHFALTWASDEGNMPRTLVAKTLNDVLRTWADIATKEKGVLRYQLPVLSTNVLRRDVLNSDEVVVALDVLRTRIEAIVRNIRELEEVPGAVVLRGGPENVSLTETRLRLADIMRFRVQPLLLQLRADHTSSNPETTLRFLEAQLAYNEREADSARERADALRRTLETYTFQVDEPQQGTVSSRQARSDTVMPQLGESFLDRLIDLAKQRNDLEYRQELVDEIKNASLAALPYEQEVAYYEQILGRMRGIGSSGGITASGAVEGEMREVVAAVEESIRDVNAIYELISLNMNPSTVLYTATSPPIGRVERALPLRQIATWAALLLLVSIPVILAVVLLTARIREEEALERNALSGAPVDSPPTMRESEG